MAGRSDIYSEHGRVVSDEDELRGLLRLCYLHEHDETRSPQTEATDEQLRIRHVLWGRVVDAFVNEEPAKSKARLQHHGFLVRYILLGANATLAAGPETTDAALRAHQRVAAEFLTFALDWLDAEADKRARREMSWQTPYQVALAQCKQQCEGKGLGTGGDGDGCPSCPLRMF